MLKFWFRKYTKPPINKFKKKKFDDESSQIVETPAKAKVDILIEWVEEIYEIINLKFSYFQPTLYRKIHKQISLKKKQKMHSNLMKYMQGTQKGFSETMPEFGVIKEEADDSKSMNYLNWEVISLCFSHRWDHNRK